MSHAQVKASRPRRRAPRSTAASGPSPAVSPAVAAALDGAHPSLSAYLGRPVALARRYGSDGDAAERARVALWDAGIEDAAVCLGVGETDLWVLTVPLSRFVRARAVLAGLDAGCTAASAVASATGV